MTRRVDSLRTSRYLRTLLHLVARPVHLPCPSGECSLRCIIFYSVAAHDDAGRMSRDLSRLAIQLSMRVSEASHLGTRHLCPVDTSYVMRPLPDVVWRKATEKAKGRPHHRPCGLRGVTPRMTTTLARISHLWSPIRSRRRRRPGNREFTGSPTTRKSSSFSTSGGGCDVEVPFPLDSTSMLNWPNRWDACELRSDISGLIERSVS